MKNIFYGTASFFLIATLSIGGYIVYNNQHQKYIQQQNGLQFATDVMDAQTKKQDEVNKEKSTPPAKLECSNVKLVNNNGILVYTGTVKNVDNVSTSANKYITYTVKITSYGANHEVLGTDVGFLDDSSLDPNEETAFKVYPTSLVDTNVKSFKAEILTSLS